MQRKFHRFEKKNEIPIGIILEKNGINRKYRADGKERKINFVRITTYSVRPNKSYRKSLHQTIPNKSLEKIIYFVNPFWNYFRKKNCFTMLCKSLEALKKTFSAQFMYLFLLFRMCLSIYWFPATVIQQDLVLNVSAVIESDEHLFRHLFFSYRLLFTLRD